jgi:hypothetical protein
MALALKRWPEAVLGPDSLPYIEATPEKLCPADAFASRQELPFDELPPAALA